MANIRQMMNIDTLLSIKKILLKKIDNDETYTEDDILDSKSLLEASAQLYYGSGNTILSDNDYDRLLEEHRLYTGDILVDPSQIMNLSQKVEGNKIIHTAKGLLGTLGNVFNTEELYDWLTKRINHAKNLHALQLKHLSISLKYDGCSAAMDVDDDIIISAYSRGDEGAGEDYSHIFKGKINISDFGYNKASIKFEVVMSWDDFDEVNEMRERDGKEAFANPRSAVAGLLSWKDITEEYIVMLTVIPLMIEGMAKKGHEIGDHSYNRKLEILDELNFDNCLFYSDSFFHILFSEENGEYYVDSEEKDSLEDCITQINNWRNDPEQLAYMIDGLVIDLLDDDARKDLGHYKVDGKDCPRFAIALKFPYKSAETTLKTFEFDLADSKSGRLTPCCTFDPVIIDGREFTRVSLSNMFRINKETWYENQKVMLTIRADVLGYISPIPGEIGEKEIHIPENCPVCEAKLTYNETGSWLFCPNDTCPSKITGKMLNYLRRMRIKGIAINTLKSLTDMGYISTVKDLYEFDAMRLTSEKGFGAESVTKIQMALDARTEVYDYEFFGAWNWPGVGRSMMKFVFEHMTFDSLLSISNPFEFSNTIKDVKGFETKRTNVLWKGLNGDREEINYILKKGYVKLKNSKETTTSGEKYKFVITGPLPSFPDRASLKVRLEALGHKLTGGISGNTNYLVTETPGSGTIKNKEAIKRGIPIINEKEFRKLIGI